LLIFEIFADGSKISITIADDDEPSAPLSARSATTRHTESKMDVSCDFEGLVARKLEHRAAAIGDRLTNEKPL
jgi:hypothetical protein